MSEPEVVISYVFSVDEYGYSSFDTGNKIPEYTLQWRRYAIFVDDIPCDRLDMTWRIMNSDCVELDCQSRFPLDLVD